MTLLYINEYLCESTVGSILALLEGKTVIVSFLIAIAAQVTLLSV